MLDLALIGFIGGFVFGGFFLMATTVPLVVTILGPLLPPDIDSVVNLLPAGD